MIPGIKKIEFNSQGFKDILFSPGTKELVQGVADLNDPGGSQCRNTGRQ